MKTLKREIYAHDYRDLEHLLESVEGFIENYYNRCRLHSALGYRSPESSKMSRKIETATRVSERQP